MSGTWLDRLSSKGDEVMGQLAEELVTTPAFATALERLLQAKGFLDRRVQAILSGMNVASSADLLALEDRLERLGREIRRLERRLSEMDGGGQERPGRGGRSRRREDTG